jgi:hypothetical protein
MEKYVIEFGYLDTDAPSINYLFNIGENVFDLMFIENEELVESKDIDKKIKKIKDYVHNFYLKDSICYVSVYKVDIYNELDLEYDKGDLISIELFKVEVNND